MWQIENAVKDVLALDIDSGFRRKGGPCTCPFRACPSGTSEHLPREITARGVHKALTEKIISQGESLHLGTGRSVVRGKQVL